MRKLEIYLEDLTKDAQERVLKFLEYKKEDCGNIKIATLGIQEFEIEDEALCNH